MKPSAGPALHTALLHSSLARKAARLGASDLGSHVLLSSPLIASVDTPAGLRGVPPLSSTRLLQAADWPLLTATPTSGSHPCHMNCVLHDPGTGPALCPHPRARRGHQASRGSSFSAEGTSHSPSVVTRPRCAAPQKVRQWATREAGLLPLCLVPVMTRILLQDQLSAAPSAYPSEGLKRGRKESRMRL